MFLSQTKLLDDFLAVLREILDKLGPEWQKVSPLVLELDLIIANQVHYLGVQGSGVILRSEQIKWVTRFVFSRKSVSKGYSFDLSLIRVPSFFLGILFFFSNQS